MSGVRHFRIQCDECGHHTDHTVKRVQSSAEKSIEAQLLETRLQVMASQEIIKELLTVPDSFRHKNIDIDVWKRWLGIARRADEFLKETEVPE